MRKIIFYHALSLLHVGAHVFLCCHSLKLFAKLLVSNLHLEHLWIELHRSVLYVEAIFRRNMAICSAVCTS